MKILRPFTGTGAVFFPIGKPPAGTCEFASKICLRHCYAALPDWPDFDEEIRIPEETKGEIHRVFTTAPTWWIVDEIQREMDGLQTDILHWFGSGDCLTKDMPKILEIIEEIEKGSLSQMGFTRNKTLWALKKNIFALSVESKNELTDDGMFSVPDFTNGTNIMYYNNRPTQGGRCGPDLCNDRIKESLTHFINCRICKRLKLGCFDRIMGRDDPPI